MNKPGGILIKPVIFHNIETDEGVHIVHAGYRLCGYPFIIHGGIIATLLNETFKRNASLSKYTTSNLKDDFKVENLTINYRRPTLANQFLIVKTKKKESPENDNRTIVLESVIEDSKVRRYCTIQEEQQIGLKKMKNQRNHGGRISRYL